MLPADHYIPMARAAEAAGFHSIAVPDSVFFPETVSGDYPFTEGGERWWAADTPFLDPFVAIPAMAAVTERITFLTNVLKLPLRSPLLVASLRGEELIAGSRHMVVLEDDRYTYAARLVATTDQHAATFRALVRSIQPIPRPARQPPVFPVCVHAID